MQAAACKDLPSWWFVGELNEWETDRAKDVCARCPVVAECRALSDELEGVFPPDLLQGVWAGENPRERAMRRSRGKNTKPPMPFQNRRKLRWTKATAPCGTITRFQSGCSCFDCSEANRYSLAAYRRRRREARRFGLNHNCRTAPRCDACKKRRAKQERERRMVTKAAQSTGVTLVCAWDECDTVMLETDRRKQKRKFCSKACGRKWRWKYTEKPMKKRAA